MNENYSFWIVKFVMTKEDIPVIERHNYHFLKKNESYQFFFVLKNPKRQPISPKR